MTGDDNHLASRRVSLPHFGRFPPAQSASAAGNGSLLSGLLANQLLDVACNGLGQAYVLHEQLPPAEAEHRIATGELAALAGLTQGIDLPRTIVGGDRRHFQRQIPADGIDHFRAVGR